MEEQQPKPSPPATVPPARPRGKPGGPRKLNDPIRRARLLTALELGVNRKRAYMLVGVDQTTFNKQLREDPAFADQVNEAQNRVVEKMLQHIAKAAEGDWRAAAWILEHILPDEYGRRNADTVTPEMMLAAFSQLADRIVDALPEKYRKTVFTAIEDVGSVFTVREKQ